MDANDEQTIQSLRNEVAELKSIIKNLILSDGMFKFYGTDDQTKSLASAYQINDLGGYFNAAYARAEAVAFKAGMVYPTDYHEWCEVVKECTDERR